jgi:hypothetical protein
VTGRLFPTRVFYCINEDLKDKIHDLQQKNSLFSYLNKTYKFNISLIRQDFDLFEFEETELIPVYSFLLCAGKFSVVEELLLEEFEKKGYSLTN